WGGAWQSLKRKRLAMVSLLIIILFSVTAFYGEIVYWRYHISDLSVPSAMEPVRKLAAYILVTDAVDGKTAPYDVQSLDKQYQPPNRDNIMGTDGLGRDVAQRLFQGARIAFQVGIMTSLIAIPLAVFLGCLAGYFGGRVDDLIVWLYSTVASMPGILFIISIAMIVGRGLTGVYLGIGLTTWTHLCRLIRGEVLKHKGQTYVRAAKALGLGDFRILFRHILPNILHIIIINFSLRFPSAVSTEVILSYLGIGAQSEPSWGVMINNARFRLWHGVWWEMTFTTLAIFLIVLAFNIFGDALRDALDPRLRSQS
ncbi:MAG: ABC transporter permease, partial [Lentisphaerae bacterium]|nr:ABC transporter permease [Lentisphaerota bacterium]